MIEAVNSVLANAQLERSTAAAVSAARSYASNPDRVQEVAQAGYLRTNIDVDVNYNKAILQIRNPDTGDVLNQFPSETVLEAQVRAEANRQARTDVSQQQEREQVPADQAFSLRELSGSAPAQISVTPKNPEGAAASKALIAAAQTASPNISSVQVSA